MDYYTDLTPEVEEHVASMEQLSQDLELDTAEVRQRAEAQEYQAVMASLESIEQVLLTDGMSRDMAIALESLSEERVLRYPVNAFTQRPSKTHLSVGLEGIDIQKRITIVTVIVAIILAVVKLVRTIINWLRGGKETGSKTAKATAQADVSTKAAAKVEEKAKTSQHLIDPQVMARKIGKSQFNDAAEFDAWVLQLRQDNILRPIRPHLNALMWLSYNPLASHLRDMREDQQKDAELMIDAICNPQYGVAVMLTRSLEGFENYLKFLGGLNYAAPNRIKQPSGEYHTDNFPWVFSGMPWVPAVQKLDKLPMTSLNMVSGWPPTNEYLEQAGLENDRFAKLGKLPILGAPPGLERQVGIEDYRREITDYYLRPLRILLATPLDQVGDQLGPQLLDDAGKSTNHHPNLFDPETLRQELVVDELVKQSEWFMKTIRIPDEVSKALSEAEKKLDSFKSNEVIKDINSNPELGRRYRGVITRMQMYAEEIQWLSAALSTVEQSRTQNLQFFATLDNGSRKVVEEITSVFNQEGRDMLKKLIGAEMQRFSGIAARLKKHMG